MPHHQVLVLGAGVAGIGAGARLAAAGVTDFKVLEKSNAVGGVWRENTYPGCACDVPSTFYSYSFAPNANWERFYGRQAEIRRYLEDTAVTTGVMEHIITECEMLKCVWDNSQSLWNVSTSKGDFTAQFVILACGPMHVPLYPSIPGIDSFEGERFHSAEWRHDVELKGKRVAVVGTGASAIQFVPEIQPECAEITVFQRTAPWVLPKRDFAVPSWMKNLFMRLPFAQQMLRAFLFMVFESLNYLLRFRFFTRLLEVGGRRNISRGVNDPELVQKLTPNFSIGCKRILQSNTWYKALGAPNAKVLPHVSKIEGNKVFASDGSFCEADVLIFGTGFEVAEAPITQRIWGASGENLSKAQNGRPQAYLGTMMHDCPNGFSTFGANTYSFSSAFAILEAQLDFIVSAITTAEKSGLQVIEVNKKKCDKYNENLQRDLKKTVWATGCSSYFQTKEGFNSVNWPYTTFYLKYCLSKFDPTSPDFVLTRSNL